MGFLRSLSSEKDQEDEKNQSFQELRKENYPVDHSLTNGEDFSESFVDSLLDFDFLRDWMASDDLSENPVLFSSEKIVLDDKESVEMKCDLFSEKSRVEEAGKLDVLDNMDQETGGMGVSKNVTEMSGDVSCGKVMVEEGTGGDGCGKFGDLRCLIEEEMGKVSLDGVSNGSDSAVSGVSVIKGGDLNDAKIGGTEVNSDDIVKSVGEVNATGKGVESGAVASVSRNSGEIVTVGVNEAKTEEQGSDEDESDGDSEDESESSSSSSSSSSSGSNDESDDEEEEVGEGDNKGKDEGGMQGGESEEAGEEGETEMEEGEIVASDVDEIVAWSDDEDDVGRGDIAMGPIRSKNEITVLPPVPPVSVTLEPHHQTLPVGAVLSIMGSQVIIEGVEKHNPLSEGSILWITESRSPLGIVDEIFGPVRNPYYVIRYNSESEVTPGIQPGTSVSFVPEFANHVLNDKSLYQKGYDASGANDEEMLEEEEFSDDEKEAEYRKMMKMKKRGTNDEKVGNKKNDKKKFKNRPGNWKADQAANPQGPLRQGNVPDHNKYPIAPAVAAPNQGNGLSSSGLGHGSVGQPVMVPPFAQIGLNPGFNMPSGGGNGIPFQQPQNLGIPGLTTNGMPWMQQVYSQPMFQIPLQSGLPFQQQIDAGSNLPPNLVLSGGQPDFGAAPGFLPLPAFLNQGIFSHSPFGIGRPGQHAPLPVNLGEQAMPSNMPQTGYNQSFQPDNAVSGNFNASPRFNRGRYSGGGRKANRRGGGRFGGGRGRQQSG